MSDWTAPQVKEHFEKILDGHERAVELLAENTRREIGHLNNLREQMFTRNEHILFVDKVESDIRVLRESKAELSGKATQSSVNFVYLLSVINMIVSVISIVYAIIHTKL